MISRFSYLGANLGCFASDEEGNKIKPQMSAQPQPLTIMSHLTLDCTLFRMLSANFTFVSMSWRKESTVVSQTPTFSCKC